MADYKRMVSYMYRYEDGDKKSNVGYARIEVRNGQMKVTLHLQLSGHHDSIFPTYLLQRKGNGMELIYFGDSVLKNQVIDSRLVANENNIMDSGYRFSDIGGILIFLNEKVFFATEWDDKPIILGEVLRALKPAKSIENEEAEDADSGIVQKGDTVISNDELEKEAAREKLSQEVTVDDSITAIPVAEDAAQVQDMQSETKNKQGSMMPESAEQSEALDRDITRRRMAWNKVWPYKVPSESQGAKANEIRLPKFQLPKCIRTGVINETSKLHTDSPAEAATDKIMDQTKESNINVKAGEDLSVEALPGEAKDRIDVDKVNTEIGASEESNERKAEESSADAAKVTEQTADAAAGTEENPVVKYIFNNYQRIYPFEDNEIIQCVKIEPKDIGYLPKELWTLSGNSFLLHGYYCYNQLIFAKMKDRFGYCYILGVPGIYHSRELIMARMFGFYNFKPIRKRELRQGDFGYWFIPVTV